MVLLRICANPSLVVRLRVDVPTGSDVSRDVNAHDVRPPPEQ